MENKFAYNLKAMREERGLTQQDLANSIGVSQQCVSEWEHEKTEPTLSYLWKIGDLFEISIDVLIGRTEW